MDFQKMIRDQVGHLHCYDAISLCEFYGNIVNVEYIVGGVSVTYENGKSCTFIRRNNS
jgi:hypothetical protein